MTAPRDIGMAECGSASRLPKCMRGQEIMPNPFCDPTTYPRPRPLPTLISTFRAVELVRVAMRRKDTMPDALARAAALLYGIEPDTILALAVQAEDACRAARRVLLHG